MWTWRFPSPSACCLLSILVISFVLEDWMVGLLSLILLYTGIHCIFIGKEEIDGNVVMEKVKDSGVGHLFKDSWMNHLNRMSQKKANGILYW